MTRHSTLTAALFGAVALTAALPAMADGKSVCFPSYLIDHTSIPNDQTILFHMRGHQVYKANVINKSAKLRMISHVPSPCTWLVSITQGRAHFCQAIRNDPDSRECMIGAATSSTGTAAGIGGAAGGARSS